MSAYQTLARFYDRLTEDVDYIAFADRYESAFRTDGGEFHLLLDLCCGTGSLTYEMTKRGYEMISVDASFDMLMEAQTKCASLSPAPLFLLQQASELDLYGTVDAAFCSLEGMNYLPPDEVEALFGHLRNFIRPGGLFLFDLRSPEYLSSLDGETFVDEDEDVLCLWRADFDDSLPALVYGMDLFSREGRLWKRSREEHVEYAHKTENLSRLMERHGFHIQEMTEDGDRLWFCVKREG